MAATTPRLPHADPIARPRAPLAPGAVGPRAVVRELRRLQDSPLRAMDHYANTYGDVYRLSATAGHNAFFLRGAPQVRHVLITNQDNYRKSNQYELLHRILGLGLVTSEGEPWQRRRALIQPMFAKRHLGPFAEHMANASVAALDRWDRTWTEGQTVELAETMSAMTLDVVGRALVGTDFTARAGQFGEALGTVLQSAGEAGRSPLTQIGGGVRQIGVTRALKAQPRRWKRINDATDVLDDVVLGLIDARSGAAGARDLAAREDLLGLLMAARDPETGAALDRTQLRDELMTFVTAGHETTANGLVWMWYLLSQNPAAREQMLAEVDEVLEGRVPTAADAERLPWTTACFQEAMRLFPPVWHVQRASIGEDVVGGFHVPAGSLMVISTWTTHRDPAVWPNPAGFDPRRFLGETAKERPRHAYLPFAGGRRVCIGQGFAMMEATILTAMIAQRFVFDLVPGAPVEAEPTVTLRPAHGMPMTIHRRVPAPAATSREQEQQPGPR